MGTRRVVDWRIEPGESDDGFHLYLRDRRVLRDTSITEINKHLKRTRQPGQTVHQIADDGYVTDITKTVERRQPAVRRRPSRRRVPVRMPLIRF